MSFDGICLYSIVNELKNSILGSQIDKVYKVSRDKLIINLRKNREDFNLLISINPRFCRMHLTFSNIKAPDHPPAFCMLLRKHLIGGRVIALNQEQLERVVYITISNTDEFMRSVELKLIVEIMGKHSNISLLKDGVIIDAMKRVPSSLNRYREILPGIKYVMPPIGDKVNILNIDKEFVISTIENAIFKKTNKNVSRWILENFMGISGQTAQEIAFRANIDHKKKLSDLTEDEITCLAQTLQNLKLSMEKKTFVPILYFDPITKEPKNFWVFPLKSNKSNEGYKKFKFTNTVVDKFYAKLEKNDHVINIKNRLCTIINKNLEKLKRELKFSKAKLDKTFKAEDYKQKGEILTANLYKIKPGQSQVLLSNFYTGDEVTITLNEKLSPADNAQAYFKQYKKLQSSKNKIKTNIKKLLAEIDYLENCLIGIKNSNTIDDLHEVQLELKREGYIKYSGNKSCKTSKPMRFKSSDGFNIYVGKNNKQNDNLTFKIASPNDIWVHTKNAPGSHVIIKSSNRDIPSKTLYEACMIAAYFSKSRYSSNVPVDYTVVKYVKKPSGAKPGFVIYTNQKTLYVTPKKSLIKNLSF